MLSRFDADVRDAARAIRHHRSFASAVVGVLGLGVGATVLIFSIVSGVLLRPLPFRNPGRLVMIWGEVPQVHLGFRELPIHGRVFSALRDNGRAFRSVSALRARFYNIGEGATGERVNGAQVTSEFFQTIGSSPALGRAFQLTEETPGADRVAVLGWDLWQRRFGGDPRLVGRTIPINGEPYTVVGVAAPGFAFPRGAEMPGNFQFPSRTEIWTPMEPPPRGPSELAVVGRTLPGVTLAAAQQDLDRVTRIAEDALPAAKGWFGMRPVAMTTQIVGNVTRMLLVLLAAVGALLAIACFNAAQLLLARLQERRHELAVRAALGASGRRLAGALLIEAFTLTLLGGVIGTVLSAAGIRLVRTLGPARLPRLAEVAFDGRVAAAAVGITVLVGLAFGLLPALGARRVDLADALRRGGRRASGDARSARSRRILIAGEIALSVVLVACAGLFVRSLANEVGTDPGFAASRAITFEVALPPLRYPEQQFSTYMEHPRSVPFLTDALARIRAIPGVTAAAIGKPLPMSGAQEATGFVAQGVDLTLDPAHPTVAEYTVASPDLFPALGVPLVRGRDFAPSDVETSVPVVIVNEAMAKWLWPGADPVGRQLHLGGTTTAAPWMSVVGVVGDMKRYALTQDARPEMFVPYTQKPYPTFGVMQFAVRTAGDPVAEVHAIQRAIAAVDPAIPIARVRTMDALVGEVSANARFATLSMTAFGIAALTLAMIGLYGVIAYGVHRRRQEFGIRTALGATPRQIVSLVLADGLRLSALGIAIGVAGALAVGRGLRSLLFHVSPTDPLTLAGTVTLLVFVALLACVLPAGRASAVDPRAAFDDV